MTDIFPGYGFESHYVEIDGHRIHYVDEGQGEVLLMVHGNPTWSYLYRHFISGLKDSYRCIALDHLGFGYSGKPKWADYSMRAHIMRLDSFISKLGLKDITLVVQDWGGIIGLSWAARHKELVKRLVVMNTAAFLPRQPLELLRMKPVPWGFPLLWSLKIPVLGELFVQGLNGFARFMVPLGTSHRERLTPEVMAGYLDPYPTWKSRKAHLESVRQIPILPSHPTWQLLQETGQEISGWEVPAQIIWGMKDPVFVPWFLEEFERRLPNHAPTLKIGDASHFLQDDTPGIIVARIREFLGQREDPGMKSRRLHAVI
ncbi:MAG: alpha/beta fold hydrolase [Deltaproteobacteria bacterium]|nr:alpha/beta fold hydrolase [Deltaproteobacteria bacterium]